MKKNAFIKSLRIALRMTQAEFSKSLKLHASTISSWETASRQPSAKHAYAIIGLCQRHNIKVGLEDLISE